MRKNKRGDIPVTILVIGVFVICSLAMLSFLYSINKTKNSFMGIDLVEKANLEIEKNSLETYYDEEIKTIWISFKEGLEFFKERKVFSISYGGS